MKVLFRVDSSKEIGHGHLMRCLTFAEYLSGFATQVVFIVRNLEGNINLKIKKNKFEFFEIPNNNSTSDYDISIKDDVFFSNKIFKVIKPDLLIVDHYSLNITWEKAFYKRCKLGVIDDLRNRRHLCDFLVDNSYGSDLSYYKNLVNKECKIFTGIGYALINKRFFSLRNNALRRKKFDLSRILISFGGSDPKKNSLKVLNKLNHSGITGIDRCDILLSSSDTVLIEECKQILSSLKFRAFIHINSNKMPELLSKATLCIGASGTSTWERVCMGVPSIQFSVANNQKYILDELDKIGIVKKVNNVGQLITHLQNNIWMKKSSEICRQIINPSQIINLLSFIVKIKIDIFISSEEHPVYDYLKNRFIDDRFDINFIHDSKKLNGGHFLFLISANEIIKNEILQKYNFKLVVHASNLPDGKGWSPHIYQIIQGSRIIFVSLIEAAEKLDSGDVWKKTKINIPKHFLYNEINNSIFEETLSLIKYAVNYFHIINPSKQKIINGRKYKFYKKRSPKDSELNINKSIKSQFDILRVADPRRYPAFIKINGKKYIIKIEKDDYEN